MFSLRISCAPDEVRNKYLLNRIQKRRILSQLARRGGALKIGIKPSGYYIYHQV
jgi:hypothetical protein